MSIVINPQAGDTFALTGVASVYNQPSAFQPIGVTTYRTASIAAHANNALLGKALTIAGFANANNNGTFAVLSSTATSVTVNNANGVIVSAAATASFQTQGFPVQYASRIENLWSNQQGDNVAVNANTGDTLIAVVIGLKSYGQFDLLHGTAPYYPQNGDSAGTSGTTAPWVAGWRAGLNDFNANPTVSDQANGVAMDIIATSITSNVLTVTLENGSQSALGTGKTVLLAGTKESFLNGQTVTVLAGASATKFTANLTHADYSNAQDSGSATPTGNVWAMSANSNIIDSDYTVTYPFTGPPTNGIVSPANSNLNTTVIASSPYQSSKWDIGGFYPSIYIFVASNVKAGKYNVSLNSMYQLGDTAPQDYASGALPIFDGGLNFQVYCVSGTGSTVTSSISASETTSNPATAPATVSAASGLVFSVGLMKNGNTFAAGTNGASPPVAMTVIGSGKLINSEAHYLVEYGASSTGTLNPGFSNPLGYQMLVASIGI